MDNDNMTFTLITAIWTPWMMFVKTLLIVGCPQDRILEISNRIPHPRKPNGECPKFTKAYRSAVSYLTGQWDDERVCCEVIPSALDEPSMFSMSPINKDIYI